MNLTVHKGKLTADPELKYVGAKNTALCTFTLTIPDKLDPKNREKILWLKVVAWAGLAETISKYTVKGQDILIKGRLSFSKYEKDGVKRTDWFVTAEEFEFCGSKPKTKEEAEPDYDVPF
jgi:single-strand DNA-binding protein